MADSAEVHAEESEIIVSIKTLLWHTNVHGFTLTNKSANDYYGIGLHLPKMCSSIIIMVEPIKSFSFASKTAF